jgi:hypothetical protein
MSWSLPISTLPPKPPERLGQRNPSVPADTSRSQRPTLAPSDVRRSCRRERPFGASVRIDLSASLVRAWGLLAGSTW